MTSDNGRVPVVLSVQVYPAPLQARLGHALVTSDLHLSRFINVPGDDGILTDVVDIEGRETPGGDIGEVVQMLEQCAVVSRDVLSVIDSVLVLDPQHYFTYSIIIFVLLFKYHLPFSLSTSNVQFFRTLMLLCLQ